uniref:Ribosomal protein S14 n=1 Tax=Pyramimonas parkeae TaxID=36894 RepID=A0A1D8I1V4_9CHLO|nr:ribosomal protein S14 [Pyramimonas parkeae]AOT98962.1 ribosomal protein S14 [Pyramimonas parkeae]
MKNNKQIDQYRRKLFSKNEVKRLLYKAIAKDMSLNKKIREKAACKLMSYPKNASITRLRNRCIITGRSRGIYQKFKLSRLNFRRLAVKGLIPGIFKASW